MRGVNTTTTFTVGAGTVVLSTLLGGLFGGKVLARQDAVAQHYDAFATALAAIESNYVEEVDTERLVYRAIGGMLQTLDPHSNFMDPRSYAQLRERQEGSVLRSWNLNQCLRRQHHGDEFVRGVASLSSWHQAR